MSKGVPLNDVARVMGHEHIATTLDRYTHRPEDGDAAVKSTFADFSLTPDEDQT